MRPYLAIVKDSFREALSSRVLWILLGIITLVLILLLPFQWRSAVAAKLSAGDIRNIRNLSTALKRGEQADAPPLIAYVWNSLSDDTKEQLDKWKDSRGGQAFRAREELAQNFNEIIKRDEFYQEELWIDAPLGERAKELLAKKSLSDDAKQQRNRLLLEASLPGQLEPCPEEAVAFSYGIPGLASWDLSFIPLVSRSDAITGIETFLNFFMGVFIGFFGIFAGVLITAPIIPNMLDSGSLYVLLSKPISRPLLFLAKFFGGCSFVLINAAYLIVGLWLILGFRLELWRPRLLWSIPLFLFSFAIFYSVSALSGLIWRSTVMAIVATVIFWFGCQLVAGSRAYFQGIVEPLTIRSLIQSDDQLIAVRENGEVGIWNKESKLLDDILVSTVPARPRRGPEIFFGASRSFVGLVYDSSKSQLVGVESKWRQAKIVSATAEDGWAQKEGAAPPESPRGLFLHQDEPIVVARKGVFRISTDVEPIEEPGINILGFKLPSINQPKELHPNIAAEGLEFADNADVAYSTETGEIFDYGASVLRRCGQDEEGLFQELARRELEVPSVQKMAAGGTTLAIVNREDDTLMIRLFDSTTLEPKSEHNTTITSKLSSFEMSANGNFLAVVSEENELWLFDVAKQQPLSVPGQNTVSAVSLSNDGFLMADTGNRIRSLSLPELQLTNTISPKQPFFVTLYRYVINPLYLIFPKPSELENTMHYAITGKDTIRTFGPGSQRIKIDPWQPLTSNSGFILVMLVVSSVFFYRQDF